MIKENGMKLYFRSTRDWARLQVPTNIVFRKVYPSKLSFGCLAWHLLSFVSGGKFVEYQIIKNGVVVAKACSSPKVFTLPFIPQGGYHIGPCVTIKEERGNGYYPLLLQYIMEEHPEREYYMVIDESNTASINGVRKVGFKEFAKGYKKNFRYVKISL